MKVVNLYIPKVEDLWFRQECMSDPETMAYNAGYDLSFEGYNFETGCIDFPKENHQKWFDEKMSNPNFFYAYIQDCETNEFVGYVNFNVKENKKASMGIVMYSKFKGQGYMRPAMKLLIEQAIKKGVSSLTDTVPNTRENALRVFYDFGFEKVSEEIGKKFNQDEIIYEIEKKLL